MYLSYAWLLLGLDGVNEVRSLLDPSPVAAITHADGILEIVSSEQGHIFVSL